MRSDRLDEREAIALLPHEDAVSTTDNYTKDFIMQDQNDTSNSVVVPDDGTVIAYTNDPSYFPDPDDDDCPDVIIYTPAE